ncbi:SGNH/GDSL hydrolase family protein [Spirosoma pulveris]
MKYYIFSRNLRVLVLLMAVIGCTRDYPSLDGPRVVIPPPVSTTPGSSTSLPGSSTAVPAVSPAPFDTLKVSPPRFSPDGGTFYMNTAVKLTADTLPAGAVIEYSLDNGSNWLTGSQFTVVSGGTVLSRIRSGSKLSISRGASFSLYYKRMLILGNSIMSHGPVPDLGWFNSNGMAASAPEKDFVHLLTGRLRVLYPAITVDLESGGGFERDFGTAAYSIDEFTPILQRVKPDLIVLRIGENIDQGVVAQRNFEKQYRQLLDLLASYGQPVRLVCTTSVWNKPQSDAIVRAVTLEKGHALVDLSPLVGQGGYFASQYKDPGVAAHPNDAGMQRIADLIWEKIQ